MSAHKGFRPDIEGLRAIAITAVVLYHAGVPRVTGGFVGVDLFFVLSGFLISGMLVREIETTGRVHLAQFWARRMRRLLPAASLVLLLTVLASTLLLPPTVRTDTANAVTAAALYAANWFFAANSLDYLAAEDAPSPVLHFWSLGVEEQFYLVWPLLLLALGMLAHRYGWSLRRIFAALAGAIWVASFAACVYFSTASQPVAFFSAPTRFWQLATGALLAIATPRLARIPTPGRVAMQVLGLGALLYSIVMLGTVVNAGNAYPGALALVPTMATALLVAGGTRDATTGASPLDRALGLPPLQWIGGLSYSWYLWHWPVLVLWHARFGETSTGVNLALVAMALLLAFAAHNLVENPIRFAKALQPRAGASIALGGFLMAATVAAAAGMSLTDASHIDARTIAFRPLPSDARNDKSVLYAKDCVVQYHDTAQPHCVFGDVGSTRRMVLIGDSHAANYFPALTIAARELGYALDVRVKLGCTTADVEEWQYKFDKVFTECTTWRTLTMQDLRQHPADVVVLVNASNPPPDVFSDGQLLDHDASRGAWVEGYARTLRQLQRTGATVIVLRDNPRVPGIIADCVAMHMDEPSACDFPRAFGLPEPAADLEAAALVPGARTVDLSDHICDPITCFAVRDNVLAWQRGNHYTATFARTLAEDLTARLREMLAT